MVGLKLISYFLLLTAILISRPGTELCFYNGAIDIADHTSKSNHNHCDDEIDHSKNEKNQKDQKTHKCCIDIKLSETLSNIVPCNNSLGPKLVYLPVEIQNYFIELQDYLLPNKRVVQAKNNLFRSTNDFEYPLQNYPSFQFTSTVLLLI